MTTFILHVGPHKTGSSYLQEAFVRVRPLLAERGVLYPATWGRIAHHGLPELLRGNTPQGGAEARLERQFAELRMSGYPVVLISVEGLATLPRPAVERLKALIGPDNPVRVVFYARSWADRLPSHWKQATREGATQSLPEYLYQRIAQPVGSLLVNFGAGLRVCAEVFGADALAIVSYDHVMTKRQDLFAHFAETFLDWPDPPALDLPHVNVSPDAGDIEVIRAVNALEQARTGRPPGRAEAAAMSGRYLRRAEELAGPDLREALTAHMATALLNEESVQLAALHRQLHAEFGHAMVEPATQGVFFAPRRAEIRYVHRDYLLTPGVAEALHDIHRSVGGVRP
jgi:hypothetical protein